MHQWRGHDEPGRPAFDAGEVDAMTKLLRPRRLQGSGDRPDGAPAASRSLASLLADGWERLNVRTRARVLARLIASVGSLALAVVGGGAFAKYIAASLRAGEVDVSVEDAERATPMQVYELARYVEQSDPRTFEALVHEIARMLGASPGALGPAT